MREDRKRHQIKHKNFAYIFLVGCPWHNAIVDHYPKCDAIHKIIPEQLKVHLHVWYLRSN